jgi:hypothetical protein
LVHALQAAANHRLTEDANIEACLAEIAAEEAQHAKAIEALTARRRALEERRAAFEAGVYKAEREALGSGLNADRARFMRRAAAVRQAARARDAEIEAEMRAPEIVSAMQETERFQAEVEPTLPSLPPAYQRATLENHQRNLRRLAPYVDALNSITPRIEAEPEPIAVIACASPAEGRPEALVLVMPIPFAVYSEWAVRNEDIASMLAYRLVAAMHRLLRDLGTPTAVVEYVEVHGCLAIQAWLADHDLVGDLHERTLEHIGRAYEESPELVNAGVEIHAAWIRPELLACDGD